MVITRVEKASEDFMLGFTPAPYQALPVNERDGLVLPIAAYLAERRLYQSASWKTVLKEAYTLSQWWDWLAYRDIPYTSASDEDLLAFIRGGGTRDGNVYIIDTKRTKLSLNKTLAGKLDCIFNFYGVLQFRAGLISQVIENPDAISSHKKYPISVRKVVTVNKQGREVIHYRPRLKYTNAERRKGAAIRPTPSPEQADTVINRILERRSPDRASMYNLIARLMRDAGLRACGTCDISVRVLRQALAEENHIWEYLQELPDDLASIAPPSIKNSYIRRQVFWGLEHLKSRRRKHIFPKVTEKGGACRKAPVPIDLAIELLDYIWGERAKFITARRTINRNYLPPDEIFLSAKTGNALTPAAVSNELGRAFRDCGVPGSGHRLRATFAEEVVRDLYLRARAVHGRAWQPEVVLETAAAMLRHANTKTLSVYLKNIQQQEDLLEGEPILIRQSGNAKLLRSLSEALEETVDKELLRNQLLDLMQRAGIELRDEPAI